MEPFFRFVRLSRLGAIAFALTITLLSSTLALTWPKDAHAAPAGEDPELLIQQGIQLRKEGDNEGAVKAFLRAYKLSKTPRSAAHLGMAEYRVSRWLDAEAHMAEALRAHSDPWIERSRAEIRKALDEVRTQLGWLEVLGRPKGAEVEVAGRAVGQLPLPEPLRLVTGEVHLRVAKPGFETERRTVIIPPGETARVVLDLEKAETAPPPSGAIASGAPSLSGNPNPPPIEVRTSLDQHNSWRRPAAWVSAGAAVLLTGSGIAAALVQRSRINEFDNLKKPGSNDPRCSTTATDSGGGPCAGLLAEGNLAKKIAIGSLIGGAAAAVLSVVFFVTSPSADERLAVSPCNPAIDRQGAGATCAWRF